MQPSSGVLACLVFALALQHAAALPPPPAEALGAELVDQLLGEWVLADTTSRVPTEANPSGVAYLSGNALNAGIRKLANDSNLATKDNMALSEELQALVVADENVTIPYSSFVVVSANAVTGATVAFNVWGGAKNAVRQRRLLGYASRTVDADEALAVELLAGEQLAPADWNLHWSFASSGEWQMRAIRLQPYQVLDPEKNGTVLERQAILTMGPFLKTNATLASLWPDIAKRL